MCWTQVQSASYVGRRCALRPMFLLNYVCLNACMMPLSLVFTWSMLASLSLALITAVFKFSWFVSEIYVGFLCPWPSSVLDAGIAGVLHRMQVVLASYTLVVPFLMHALQMLSVLDFFLIHVCMLSLYLFTAT